MLRGLRSELLRPALPILGLAGVVTCRPVGQIGADALRAGVAVDVAAPVDTRLIADRATRHSLRPGPVVGVDGHGVPLPIFTAATAASYPTTTDRSAMAA